MSKNVGDKKQNPYTLFDTSNDALDEDSKEGKWNIDKVNAIVGQHKNKGTPFLKPSFKLYLFVSMSKDHWLCWIRLRLSRLKTKVKVYCFPTTDTPYP